MAMVAVQWSREDPDALKTYIATDQSLTNQQRAILQNVEKNGMRALMQMGFPSTGIGGGSFNMRELRSLGIGGPGGGPPGGGRR